MSRSKTMRPFPRTPQKIGDRFVSGYTLQCQTEGCGFTDRINDRSADGLMSDMVQRKFEQKGWTVGASDRFDFCPRCTEAAEVARRARKNKLTLVPSSAPQPDGQTQETPVAETTPVPMTREDRKIIYNRLQELYVDEATGYRVPWTDAKVAADLGASVSWIAEIREQFFGPQVENPSIEELRTQMAEDSAVVDTLVEAMQKLQKDGDALVGAIKTLATQVKAAQDRQSQTNAKFVELLT